MPDARPYNPALHVVAWLLAVATFPLIFMGGLVTSHQAGMSVPDWPNSYGYNMFLFPPNQWVGGILYEHTHRLMGTVVGFLAIVLVACAHSPSRRPGFRKVSGWVAAASGAAVPLLLAGLAGLHAIGKATFSARSPVMHGVVLLASVALVAAVLWRCRTPDPRPWVRRLMWVVLAAVIFQGVLGGLRVVRINIDLAVVHGCFAQAFFCLAAGTVVVTSRWWRDAPDLSAADRSAPPDSIAGGRVARLAAVAVVVIFAQLVVGATMRHYRAGLAIPDFPLAFGRALPPTTEAEVRALQPPAFVTDPAAAGRPHAFAPLGSAYQRWMERWPAARPQFDPEIDLHPVLAVWLHFGHRIGAVVVTAVLGWLIVRVVRHPTARPMLIAPAAVVGVLLATQLTLGALTVLLRKPADVASLHVACGALLLLTTFVLAVRAARLYSPRFRGAPRTGFDPVAPGQDEVRAAGRPALSA